MSSRATPLRWSSAALGAATAAAAAVHAGGGTGWAVTGALAAGALLLLPGEEEGTYAVGLAAVLTPVLFALATEGGSFAAIGLGAGVAATAEVAGLARRAAATSVPDDAVRRADGSGALVVVVLTVVAGGALVRIGRWSGPDGVVGEVIALGAVALLGLLAALTPPGRAALRSLLDRT